MSMIPVTSVAAPHAASHYAGGSDQVNGQSLFGLRTTDSPTFNAITATGSITTQAYLRTGVAGSGTNGNVRIIADNGSEKWLFGTLGVPGARNFSIYDLTTPAERLSVDGTSGVITIGSTTASTSTTTGALVVAGGVGIGGSLFIGGAAISNDDFAIVGPGTALYFGDRLTDGSVRIRISGSSLVIDRRSGGSYSTIATLVTW